MAYVPHRFIQIWHISVSLHFYLPEFAKTKPGIVNNYSPGMKNHHRMAPAHMPNDLEDYKNTFWKLLVRVKIFKPRKVCIILPC